jgi:hypothetical protein
MSLLHYVEEQSPIRAIVYNPSATWEPFGPNDFYQLKKATVLLGLSLENKGMMKRQRELRRRCLNTPGG